MNGSNKSRPNDLNSSICSDLRAYPLPAPDETQNPSHASDSLGYLLKLTYCRSPKFVPRFSFHARRLRTTSPFFLETPVSRSRVFYRGSSENFTPGSKIRPEDLYYFEVRRFPPPSPSISLSLSVYLSLPFLISHSSDVSPFIIKLPVTHPVHLLPFHGQSFRFKMRSAAGLTALACSMLMLSAQALPVSHPP